MEYLCKTTNNLWNVSTDLNVRGDIVSSCQDKFGFKNLQL